MFSSYLTLITRDLKLSLSRSAETMTTLFFFIVTASLFAFGFNGDAAALQKAATGIIWVTAVLASLLSLEGLHHRDAEDGTFDLLLMAPLSPMGIALSKMAAHWILSGLTLVVASIVVSQMLLLSPNSLSVLLPSLLLGTVYMSLLGGMGAMLTFGARRPGLLLALLILPLYIPMLILGLMAMETAKACLLLQLALVIAALPLTAWVAGASLRMNWRS